jgi:hypothetical protein
MALLMYAACDGGGLNTLAGAGGIVEIDITNDRATRYFEFPDGTGGSVHMVLPTPDRQALVASSANIGQLFVIPRQGDRYDFGSFRRIETFNTLGPPVLGTDAQTAMFDFLDNEHVVCQYNRKLVRVNLTTGALDELVDIGARYPDRADILHQVSVRGPWVIVDEVVKGGIFVWHRTTNELRFLGDGFSGGHHTIFENELGQTIVLRPAFGFQSQDAHLKIEDNSMSFYNLDTGEVRTRCYSWEIENHHPTDIHVEDGFLYASFAVPGSVAKIELETGRIVARYTARPWIGTRYLSMLLDGITYAIDYGTMRNRHDTAKFTLPLFAHAFFLGRAAGTRAGFFAMGIRRGSDELYVCHRGLNRLFCLDKTSLEKRWSIALPSRKKHSRSRIKGFFYNHYTYFGRCLGVHHGTLVDT